MVKALLNSYDRERDVDVVVSAGQTYYVYAQGVGQNNFYGEGYEVWLVCSGGANPPVAKTLTSLSISGASSVTGGSGGSYACTAYYSDGSSSTVSPTWSIESGTSYASVNSSGWLTAYTVTSSKTVTLKASYGGKSTTKPITINPKKDDNVMVTFDGNGGTVYNLAGLAVGPSIQLAQTPGTKWRNLPGATNGSKTFDGWWTQPSGGTRISTSDTFSGTPTTVYAHWKDPNPKSYTVTYKSGVYGTGSLQTATKNQGVALKLKGAIFTRTGYEQTGWSVKDDGSVKSYGLNDTYARDDDLVLYPFWMEKLPSSYKVHFDANSGSGYMSPQTYSYNTPGQLPRCTFTRAGYVFQGWNLDQHANYATFDDGGQVDFIQTSYGGEYRLYAVWKRVSEKVTVTFDAKCWEGDWDPWFYAYEDGEMKIVSKIEREFTVGEHYSFPYVGRANYEFDGWYTPGGTKIDANTTLVSSSITHLVPRWRYSVKFYPNGGNGTMSEVSFVLGMPMALPRNSFWKSGYEFCGWDVFSSAKSAIYGDGELVTDASEELYAVWIKEENVAETLDCPSLKFVTGGDACWFHQARHKREGDTAMKSGKLSDYQISWIETTVSSAGTIDFSWQVSCDARCAWLDFQVDGETVSTIRGMDLWDEHMNFKWQDFSCKIPSGCHTLRWQYVRTSSSVEEAADDCAWLDAIKWTANTIYEIEFEGGDGVSSVEVKAGGAGVRRIMPSVVCEIGKVYALPACAFGNFDKRFAGWRCSNGKRYDDGMLVFNLAEPGETVTMTAIWE